MQPATQTAQRAEKTKAMISIPIMHGLNVGTSETSAHPTHKGDLSPGSQTANIRNDAIRSLARRRYLQRDIQRRRLYGLGCRRRWPEHCWSSSSSPEALPNGLVSMRLAETAVAAVLAITQKLIVRTRLM